MCGKQTRERLERHKVYIDPGRTATKFAATTPFERNYTNFATFVPERAHGGDSCPLPSHKPCSRSG